METRMSDMMFVLVVSLATLGPAYSADGNTEAADDSLDEDYPPFEVFMSTRKMQILKLFGYIFLCPVSVTLLEFFIERGIKTSLESYNILYVLDIGGFEGEGW